MQILEELEISPRPINYFANNLKFGTKEIVIPAIRKLMDEEIIDMKDTIISIKNKP